MSQGEQIPTHGPEELRLLELLKEVQQLLTEAIDSLGDKTPASPESHYLGWVTGQAVNKPAEGYHLLRSQMRTDAAKLLVRPAMEALFSGGAVMAEGAFLYHKAYSELVEEEKFARNPADEALVKSRQNQVKQTLASKYPKYPFDGKKASVWKTAKVAGMEDLYRDGYSVYCQFTHGAASAVVGDFKNATDEFDTRMVIHCVLATLELLKKHTPATVPNLAPWIKRFDHSSTISP